MHQERSYISENQQIHTQPEPEQRRPRTSRLRRIVEVGAVMSAMLAFNAGLIEAAKKPDNNEPEIQPQMRTDILGGIGSFDNPQSPAEPDGWNMITTDITPGHNNVAAFNGYSVDVETSGTLPCQSNGWVTEQNYPINPNKTYSLGFVAAYDSSESPQGIDPKVILDWKDSQGQSLNSPDNYTFTGISHADNWGIYQRTYGSGQNTAIPQGAAEVSIQIEGNQTDISCSGKLYYDNLSLTTTVDSTPPPSVGGVAIMVDPNTLPANSDSSGSNSNEIYAILAGTVIGTFAIGAAGVKIRSITKEQHK